MDISDRQLDAVNAGLAEYSFEAASEAASERAGDLRAGITNLREGRKRVPASEARVGDRLVSFAVIEALKRRPGGVTFTIDGYRVSYRSAYQLQVERTGNVL